MGTEDVTLVANFTFTPDGPKEPNTPTAAKYTLYGLSTTMYQGASTWIPIYLENTSYAKDITFTLDLPAGVTVDVENVNTTSRTSGYVVTATQSATLLTISLTGGTQIADYNGPIVQIPLTTGEGLVDGDYTYAINDITLTLTDDSTPEVTSRSGILHITTEQNIAVYSTEPRCLIFQTALLAPKATRANQGVAVMKLKPKYQIAEILPASEAPIANPTRYRVRSIPAAGALLRQEDSGETQITLNL